MCTQGLSASSPCGAWVRKTLYSPPHSVQGKHEVVHEHPPAAQLPEHEVLPNHLWCNTMNLPSVWFLGVVLILSETAAVTVPEARAGDKSARPFWTEKSAFVEGDELYVVGIASNAKTAEDGRQQAFERGKIELMNFAQVTTLEAQGLGITTQMTFEESNADRSVTVYRLLRVPLEKLLAIQGRIQSQRKAQEQGLEKARQDLLITQNSLAEKERQAEALLNILSNETRRRGLAPTQPTGSLINDLKQAEALLSKEDSAAAVTLSQVHQRVRTEQQKNVARCARLEKGMSKQEVRGVLGEPDADSQGLKPPTVIHQAPVAETMEDHALGLKTEKQLAEDDYQRSRAVYEATNAAHLNTGKWFYGKAGRLTIYFDKVGEVDLIIGCKGK